MRLFSFGKLFWDLFLLFFFLELFLEMVREKRGGKEDAHSVKYESIQCVVHKEQKNRFKSFQVKLQIQTSDLKPKQSLIKPKYKAQVLYGFAYRFIDLLCQTDLD